MAYPRYVRFDRTRPITPDEVVQVDEAAVDRIAGLVERANRFGLHVSLNLHRAPGYCVNAGFQEPFDLWRDESALEAFCFHWKMWAERLRQVPADLVSFDLVNEPSVREDMNDQHGRRAPVPGSVYRKVAKAAAEAIWAVTPERLVVADGNDVGSAVIPEIADLRIAQSCRGYFPHYISHYRAPWVFRNPDDAPMPVWPGTMGGRHFSRADLEEFYRPWRALVRDGVGVHCGECGCWRETPHAVFLAWFGDVLDILTEAGIGYALWNFRGDFGLIDSRRKDVAYEEWHGHQLDRKLLELLRRH
jgi:aryl-phospho-beta-D-glucosidase BglC (GH1 family)